MLCDVWHNDTNKKTKSGCETVLLIRAIVRPEKKDEVLAELSGAGFNAATMVDVVGRGKQKGIKIGGLV